MSSAPPYHFTLLDDELILSVETNECYRDLAFKINDSESFLKELPLPEDERSVIKKITIIGEGIRVSVPANWKLLTTPMIVHRPTSPTIRIPKIEDLDLATEIFSFEGSAAAVRFHDDKGLLSNERIELTSGIRPNDWQGKIMSSYWPEDELKRFKRDLLREGQVNNYRYVAYLMTGQKAAYEVNARLVFYRDELVRVVKSVIPAQVVD